MAQTVLTLNDLPPVKMGNVVSRLLILMRAGYPGILISEPGTGKTEILKALAVKLGAFLTVKIGAYEDPTSLAGYVVPDMEAKVTTMLSPSWCPEQTAAANEGKPGLIFLDEMGAAPDAVLAVFLRFLAERRVGDYVLPRTCSMFGAMNPPETGVGGNTLPPAMINRGTLIRCVPDPEFFTANFPGYFGCPPDAEYPGLNPAAYGKARASIASYIHRFPDHLSTPPQTEEAKGQPWSSARSLDGVSRILAAADNKADDVADLIVGTIGANVGYSMLSYLKRLDLPLPADIMAKPSILPKDADSMFTSLASVQGWLEANLTPQNWEGMWRVLGEVAGNRNVPDIAAPWVKPLAGLRNKVPTAKIQPEIKLFAKLLSDAGISLA